MGFAKYLEDNQGYYDERKPDFNPPPIKQDEKFFICSNCASVFANQEELNSHIKQQHYYNNQPISINQDLQEPVLYLKITPAIKDVLISFNENKSRGFDKTKFNKQEIDFLNAVLEYYIGVSCKNTKDKIERYKNSFAQLKHYHNHFSLDIRKIIAFYFSWEEYLIELNDVETKYSFLLDVLQTQNLIPIIEEIEISLCQENLQKLG